MRLFISAVLVSTLSILQTAEAHEFVVDTCATEADQYCALEISLPDFWLLRADPVVIDGTLLKLLGGDEAGQILSLDLSLATGAVTGRVTFDAQQKMPGYTVGLIAPDGKTFMISLEDGADWPGLQFFDDTGKRLGLVLPHIPAGWEAAVTPVEALLAFSMQNHLTFDDQVLTGSFYRFQFVASVTDGTFEVRELQRARPTIPWIRWRPISNVGLAGATATKMNSILGLSRRSPLWPVMATRPGFSYSPRMAARWPLTSASAESVTITNTMAPVWHQTANASPCSAIHTVPALPGARCQFS